MFRTFGNWYCALNDRQLSNKAVIVLHNIPSRYELIDLVIPAQAGIHPLQGELVPVPLDSRLRGNDVGGQMAVQGRNDVEKRRWLLERATAPVG